MYTATLTSQGQITIPAGMRKQMGIKPGDSVNFLVKGENVIVSKARGWESLKGVLSQYKGNYPTKSELAKAHVGKYEKNTRRHEYSAALSG